MREKDFISIIKHTLDSEYIGDDCAYLKDLGIVVTQDNLVEGVHFLRNAITPFQLGYKSVMVNISDVCASGAQIKYLTIGLSVTGDVDEEFIKEFYDGAKTACGNNAEIVGGDVTSSDKIFVSVCAIGKVEGRKISSRKNAKTGYKVIVSGLHGSSAAGLKLILDGQNEPESFVSAHLIPQAQVEFCRQISQNISVDYAMMDTSDGLMDALSTIANESGVLLEIDFEKIPYDNGIKQFENWRNLVLFGGEDYGIIAVVPENFICGGTVIGYVKDGLGVDLKFNSEIVHYSGKDVEEKIFNHFKKD